MKLFRKPEITRKKIIIIALIVLFIAVFQTLNNSFPVLTEYEFSSEKFPKGLDGFRVVQISDLHNETYGRNNSRLMAKIKACEPDIIVITGDIADEFFTKPDVAVDFCRQAAEICPTYYVTGNHEYEMDRAKFDELCVGIEGSGAVFLRNEAVKIGTGEDSFTLIGLDDECVDGGRLAKLMTTVDEGEFTLVLAHEPQNFDDYAMSKPDLVLSGHAHGGLIRLPFIGGLFAPDQGFFPKYTAGRYDCGESTMFVSRGVGNSTVTKRVFDPPEVVCITLKSA